MKKWVTNRTHTVLTFLWLFSGGMVGKNLSNDLFRLKKSKNGHFCQITYLCRWDLTYVSRFSRVYLCLDILPRQVYFEMHKQLLDHKLGHFRLGYISVQSKDAFQILVAVERDTNNQIERRISSTFRVFKLMLICWLNQPIRILLKSKEPIAIIGH